MRCCLIFSSLEICESACSSGLKLGIHLTYAAPLLDGNSSYIKVIRNAGDWGAFVIQVLTLLDGRAKHLSHLLIKAQWQFGCHSSFPNCSGSVFLSSLQPLPNMEPQACLNHTSDYSRTFSRAHHRVIRFLRPDKVTLWKITRRNPSQLTSCLLIFSSASIKLRADAVQTFRVSTLNCITTQ